MLLFTLLGLPREGLIQVRVSRSLHFCGLLTLVVSDSPVTLTLALGLCKSRSTDVQLAAGLW
jgi:hypothetical protein